MTAVWTVQGPIPPGQLGPTLPHEHILCDFYRVSGQLDHLLNDEDLAVEELTDFIAAGGSGVVECSTIDLGRDVKGLRRIASRTGLHLIAGTGWYRQPFYPPDIDRRPTDDLARQMIDDLTVGIGETGIRAGIIGEIGVNLDYATAQEERVLRAAARAQRATGAPLTTHASMYPVGRTQLALLAEEGVDPNQVIIGHCDTYLDREYHLDILKTGAYVQFDTIGRDHMNPDARRADALVTLLELGWGERLLLSSDRCYRSDLRAFGGAGYGHVMTAFCDRLRVMGVTDDKLHMMTVENPRRVLTW